jgi:hypothetical protein
MKIALFLSLLGCAFAQAGQVIPVQETLRVPRGNHTLVIKAAVDSRLRWGSVACFEIEGAMNSPLPTGTWPGLLDALNASRVAKSALFVALSPNNPPDFGDGQEQITEATLLGGHLDTNTQPVPFSVIGVRFDRANSRGFDNSEMFPCESDSFVAAAPITAVPVSPPSW